MVYSCKFLSQVKYFRKKLSRIEHVLIVKVSFERRKVAKVFMTQVQVFFRKSLSIAIFERNLSSVSLALGCTVAYKLNPFHFLNGVCRLSWSFAPHWVLRFPWTPYTISWFRVSVCRKHAKTRVQHCRAVDVSHTMDYINVCPKADE